MGRFLAITSALIGLVAAGWAATVGPWAWWVLGAVVLAIVGVAAYDLLQRGHSILRNYGASGKVAAGNDIVKCLIQGADYTNSARAMMMAVGCIQAQICHTGQCPSVSPPRTPSGRGRCTWVTRANGCGTIRRRPCSRPWRSSMGVSDPTELSPQQLHRNIGRNEHLSYAELYDWLGPGELLAQPPESWSSDWSRADAGTFRSV